VCSITAKSTSPVLCTLLIFSFCYCFLQVFATSQISHAVSVSIYGFTCRVGFRQVPILLHTLGTSRIPAALVLSNFQQPAMKRMLCQFDSRTTFVLFGIKKNCSCTTGTSRHVLPNKVGVSHVGK